VKSFSMAELEARKLKYPNTGTESLLLGILTEGEVSFQKAQVRSLRIAWLGECLSISPGLAGYA
jgi:hypothetical protein